MAVLSCVLDLMTGVAWRDCMGCSVVMVRLADLSALGHRGLVLPPVPQ